MADLDTLRELAWKARERMAAGHVDLRDVGELLTGKWDQDFPAALLAALDENERLRSEMTDALRTLYGLLTPRQRAFLRIVADDPMDINEIAYRCETRISSASKTRNILRDRGYIEPWDDYEEPIRITSAGRSALAHP